MAQAMEARGFGAMPCRTAARSASCLPLGPAIAVTSALAQKPQIALGDALGASIVNIGVILGLAVAIDMRLLGWFRSIPFSSLRDA